VNRCYIHSRTTYQTDRYVLCMQRWIPGPNCFCSKPLIPGSNPPKLVFQVKQSGIKRRRPTLFSFTVEFNVIKLKFVVTLDPFDDAPTVFAHNTQVIFIELVQSNV
jgi:hypothetical protein